ncbi:hypothetical protein [Streptomyces sp. NBC_01431]|uniref:hypothetical protein n=1 Tax=Streptomyces sp. NBC_01431 TaxID=2903863 RepID=UPI002E339F5C|nr:hypothetical protein [Streptomyces sp. NBC_01431]
MHGRNNPLPPVVQELQRGALAEHFGTPAVRSLKHKGEAAPAERLWWITEPVAQAIAVLEALSWHPTHLFAIACLPPRHTGRQPAGRRGIRAEERLDFFIAHVNAHRHNTGLTEIPPDTAHRGERK